MVLIAIFISLNVKAKRAKAVTTTTYFSMKNEGEQKVHKIIPGIPGRNIKKIKMIPNLRFGTGLVSISAFSSTSSAFIRTSGIQSLCYKTF